MSLSTSRKINPLSESLMHNLNWYALGATTAGVSVLALTTPAEAKVVYTPTHHLIGRNGRYKLDLNHDKIPDFSLVNTYSCNSDFCQDLLSAAPFGGNDVEGKKGFLGIPYAYALKKGSVIGPTQPFSGKLMASSDSGQGTIGRWLNVTNGYLGLRFSLKGKTHYGWARMSVRVYGGALIKTTLTGYAYETIPNKPIIAGKMKGPDVITVSDTLGGLAQGAAHHPKRGSNPKEHN